MNTRASTYISMFVYLHDFNKFMSVNVWFRYQMSSVYCKWILWLPLMGYSR